MLKIEQMPLNKPVDSIAIEVAPGELVDKITILEIKRERIADPRKRANVMKELTILRAAHARSLPSSQTLRNLTRRLKAVNDRLWEIEDALRDCERNQRFDARFIDLARSVYISNDARARLKREINHLLGSAIIEEKSYTPYA
jgi:hypothetical protein